MKLAALAMLLTLSSTALAQDSLKVDFPGGQLVIPLDGVTLTLELPPIEVQDTTQLPDLLVQDTTFLPDVIVQDTTQLPDVELPGDTVQLPDVELPPDTIPSGEPPVCRDGWECTQLAPDPEPDPDPTPTSPPLSISGLTLTMIGDSLHVSWNNRPNPDRGGVPVDGYIVRGGMNGSGDAPLPHLRVVSSPAGWTLELYGSYWVCVYPFNGAGAPEPSCKSVAHPDTQLSLDALIVGCLAEAQDQQLGIYYSRAADACVPLGGVTDRQDVNRIHAAYWRARGVAVNDDPFPGTVGDLATDAP